MYKKDYNEETKDQFTSISHFNQLNNIDAHYNSTGPGNFGKTVN
jgi:hypothetical protein